MKDSKNTGIIIGSLIVGVAIGGLLGILFAPDKGSETRKKLAGKKDDLGKEMKEKLNAFLGEAKKEFDAEKVNT